MDTNTEIAKLKAQVKSLEKKLYKYEQLHKELFKIQAECSNNYDCGLCEYYDQCRCEIGAYILSIIIRGTMYAK